MKRADYLKCRTWLRSRTAGGWKEMTTAATHDTRNIAETDLIACVPHLRAFAWFLTKNRGCADALVQDTIARALTEAHPFQPGTKADLAEGKIQNVVGTIKDSLKP
jgi:hypothetical protein